MALPLRCQTGKGEIHYDPFHVLGCFRPEGTPDPHGCRRQQHRERQHDGLQGEPRHVRGYDLAEPLGRILADRHDRRREPEADRSRYVRRGNRPPLYERLRPADGQEYGRRDLARRRSLHRLARRAEILYAQRRVLVRRRGQSDASKHGALRAGLYGKQRRDCHCRRQHDEDPHPRRQVHGGDNDGDGNLYEEPQCDDAGLRGGKHPRALCGRHVRDNE